MPDPSAAPIAKACAGLVDARGRLLVFDHPAGGGAQIVKGTIEPGESPEAAVRRELLEEAGIRFDGPVRPLGTLLRGATISDDPLKRRHPQLWHVFLMHSTQQLPEAFRHVARGSPEEDGLIFSFRWLPIDAPLDAFAQHYRRAIDVLRGAQNG